jgi:hypothetical protein
MPLGNSELAGIAYFDGNPSSAPVIGFDVAKGTLVIDQTNGELYQKIAAQGTNTGGYVTIGSQMEKVTTLGSYVDPNGDTLQDVVGLTGFVLEAATTYKISGAIPVSGSSTGGIKINLNFSSSPTSTKSYAIASLASTALHQSTVGTTGDTQVFGRAGLVLFVAFEAIVITALATTMKVQAAQFVSNATASTVALGGTVTVTKVL